MEKIEKYVLLIAFNFGENNVRDKTILLFGSKDEPHAAIVERFASTNDLQLSSDKKNCRKSEILFEVHCGGLADHETKRLYEVSGAFGRMRIAKSLSGSMRGENDHWDVSALEGWNISAYL